jgi:hypothetical protein
MLVLYKHIYTRLSGKDIYCMISGRDMCLYMESENCKQHKDNVFLYSNNMEQTSTCFIFYCLSRSEKSFQIRGPV